MRLWGTTNRGKMCCSPWWAGIKPDTRMTTRINSLGIPMATCLLAACLSAAAWAGEIHVPAEEPTIQDAIDAAQGDDEIIVAPGRYKESVDLKGKSITVRSEKGPAVTIIDGSGNPDSVLKCISGEGPSTRIDGFTVTGGTGYGGLYSPEETVGGGLVCINSSPTIVNCTFVENTATYHGGGIYNGRRANTVIRNCKVQANEAERGGGIFNTNGAPEAHGTEIRGNIARHGGGGMYNYASDARVVDCSFTKNKARFNGGAIYDYNSNGEVVRCSFNENVAMLSGNAMYRGYRSATAVDSDCRFVTVYDNIAGSGAYMLARGRPTGGCCIGGGCLIVEESACTKAGGLWLGAGSDCDEQSLLDCPQPVAGDINSDGAVDMMDLVLLMTNMNETGN